MSAVPAETDYIHVRDNTHIPHLPGRYGLPLLGRTFRFITEPFEVLDSIYREYGPISKISLTFQKMALALGPEHIQTLMLDRDQLYSARMGYDGPLGDFFAGGLLVRDFAEHKMHRRIMQTAFKTPAMKQYIDSMHPLIDRSLTSWSTQRDFYFYPNIKTLLLDIGALVFLGLDLEGQETQRLNQSFLDMMAGTLALIRKDWPGLLYRKGMNGRRQLEQFFMDLVPQKRSGNGTDMASHFARETTPEGELFPDDVVAYHLIFLLLAAHDTTTSALTMASYYLAQHPEWQERLREEARSLGTAQVEYDDLGQLVESERAFHEVMRLHPPVPQLMRRTVRETELGGYAIPAHTMVQVSPLYVHRMEAWWTDPHRFDPDRFAPGREEHKQHPFLWAPFGGGAHKCIGMHFADMLFKTIMTQLLTRYRLHLPEGYKLPARLQHFPFAKPMDDLPLVLERL